MASLDSDSLDAPAPSKWRWLLFGTPAFCLALLLSLVRFLSQPDLRLGGVAWNALFQIFGPTAGTLTLAVLVIMQMLNKRIRWIVGLGLLLMLLMTSLICLRWSTPVLLSVSDP